MTSACSTQPAAPRDDLFLRETLHRCSNDFQLVVSLLSLQSRRTATPEAREALADATAPVAVLARSRVELSRQQQPSLQTALRQLCEALHSLAEPRSILISLEAGDEVQGLSSEQVATLALAVNELATNAIKHAFEEGMAGRVSVVARRGGREAVIIIDDEGLPMPEAAGRKEERSGMGLLRRLVASVDGSLVLPANGCKCFEIRIASGSKAVPLNHLRGGGAVPFDMNYDQQISAQAPGARPTLPPIYPTSDASAEAAVVLAAAQRDVLSRQLLASGALLFRGFDLRSVEEFATFVDAFSGGAPLFGYAGGASPRRALGSAGRGVYSSTEYPSAVELSLHNELSYTDVQPSRLFFFCLVAPERGGATTLGDSRRILARIDPDVLAAFRAKGVRYVRLLSPDAGSGYSWQDAFETDDPRMAEAACRRLGSSFAWRSDGFLRVSHVRPATARHPETGEEVWFNQADGFHPSALDAETHASQLAWYGGEDEFRLNVSFGDGTPIPRGMFDVVRAAIAAEKFAHDWQAGDVAVLDNHLMAHGRMPFDGPRKIALAMT